MEPSAKQAELSERRTRVVELRAAGRTLQHIADELGVSVKAVRIDLARAARKPQ